MTVQLRAYAKINLYLDVTGKRTDGYHDILSLMQTVSLYDTVEISVKDSNGEISLECDAAQIPNNEKNLAYRAADAFYQALGYRRETHIGIEKRIPVSAGLAGGSTDAAAVLRGLNRIFNNVFSEVELCAIGKPLGADIPFCIVGGTAEVTGIGENLRALPDILPLSIVIAKNGSGVSTPEAYRALDTMFDGFTGRYSGGTDEKERYGALLSAMHEGDSEGIARHLYNVFENVILPQHSEANALRVFFLENGAIASMMSGSGPSMFGIFRDIESARRVAARLNKERESPIAFAVTTVPKRDIGVTEAV